MRSLAMAMAMAAILAASAPKPASAEPITIGLATWAVVKFVFLAVATKAVVDTAFPPGTHVCDIKGDKPYAVPKGGKCANGVEPTHM